MTPFFRELVLVATVLIALFVGIAWTYSNFLFEPSLKEFRVNCAAVGGKAVWNGRHLECLK